MLLSFLSLSLMMLDNQYRHLDAIRAFLSLTVYPLQYAVHAPISAYNSVANNVRSRADLLAENEQLKSDQLLLKFRVQKLAALEKENTRLKALLKSSASAGDKVLVAKLLEVDPDPFSQRIILDKGRAQGVYEGQPVLDANGVMGQIVRVGFNTSTALLLTDISHALPVQSNRSGTRSIAVGIGSLDSMKLSHVTNSADLKEGDILVTSGLGRRFPSGYPVGKIVSIKHDPGQPFIRVKVEPAAHLDRSREVLLVWPQSEAPTVAESNEAPAQTTKTEEAPS